VLPLVSIAAAEDETVVVEGLRVPDPRATSADLTSLSLGPGLPPAQDLASVLDTATGTTVRRLGGLGDFAVLGLRGSTARQVEVFLDGIPLNPGGESAVNLSELPVAAFERVDLYRGSAPVRYASNAIGGVADLVTPTGAIPTTASAAAGSFGTAKVDLVLGPRHGEIDTFFSASQFHTEGNWPYFDDAGTEYNLLDDRTETREHNGIDRTSAVGRVRWDPGPLRLTLLDAFARSDQDIPGSTSEAGKSATLGTLRNLVVLGAQPRMTGAVSASPRAWWSWREESYDDRDAEVGVGAQWSRDRSHALGAQLDLAAFPVTWATAAFTARALHERFLPLDLLRDQGDGERLRNALSLAASADLHGWAGRLTVSPVVATEIYDNALLGDVPYEDTPVAPESEDLEAYVLPRLGVLVRPWTWLSLKANGGRYARPPDLLELFGDHGTTIGNTDLVPESAWAFDVGFLATAPALSWLAASGGATYARTYATDLIVYTQNAQGSVRAANLRDTYVRSTEAHVELEVLDVLRVAPGVTWTLSRNLDADPAYADNQLPRVPELELDVTTAVHCRDSVELAHTWSHTSATYTDAANIFEDGERDLHSVAISLRPGPRWPSVKAEVLNLFDVRGSTVDRNPVSSEDDSLIVKPLADFSGYPLPGRTAMVAVSWTEFPGVN
jgi:iron complex outermembrane receptor protein